MRAVAHHRPAPRPAADGIRSARAEERVPESDVAGHVEAVGPGVTRFRPRDEVFGETVSGYQWHNGWACAEHVSVSQCARALKPRNVTFEQAAAVPTSGLIALHNLRPGCLKPGRHAVVTRCRWRRRGLRCAACEGCGRDRDGRRRRGKARRRQVPRRRPRDRPCPSRLQSSDQRPLHHRRRGDRSFRQCRRALTPEGSSAPIGHDGFGNAAGRWLGRVPRVSGARRHVAVQKAAGSHQLLAAGQEWSPWRSSWRDWGPER